MFGIGRDGAECFSGGMEENAVDGSLVLQGNFSDFFRHRKNNMEIRNAKKFGLSILYPLGASQRLTFWAVPVRTRVEPDALVAAPVAHFDMTAQSGGAASFNGCHHSPLRCGQDGCELLTISFSV